MRRYLSFLQEIEGLVWDFEALLHPAREDYDFRAMIEQFLHVSLLNARHMISACFPPVPFSRSTRKKLCILVRLGSPFHLESSPGDVLDPRRAVFVFHNNNIVRQPSGSFQYFLSMIDRQRVDIETSSRKERPVVCVREFLSRFSIVVMAIVS